jgi:hypothetical protein
MGDGDVMGDVVMGDVVMGDVVSYFHICYLYSNILVLPISVGGTLLVFLVY